MPEVISRVLGVPRTTFFNFGTGSQVVKFAREAFVPHLLQIGVRPAYVVFGVSPDWPLRKERLWALIDRYRDSLAYRIANRSRRDDPDSMEVRISRFLDLRLALFRYRADLIHQELIPSLGCWFLGDCNRSCRGLAGGQAASFQGSGTTFRFQGQGLVGGLSRTTDTPAGASRRNLDSLRRCLLIKRTFWGCSPRCESQTASLSS